MNFKIGKNIGRRTKLIFLIILMAFLNFSLSGSYSYGAEDAEDIQNKIDKTLDKVDEAQKQLDQSQTALQKNQSQMNLTKSLIQKTETDITRKTKEIDNLNQRIELNKKILEGYIQEMYFNDENPILSLTFEDKNFSSLVSNFDQMINVKEKIHAFVEDAKRILTISRKPSREEFIAMLKVTGIGIIIIGIIGYIISLVFFGAVFPVQ